MTLHLYFARKFGFIFVGILVIFAILIALLDMVEQLRRFDTDEVSFGQAVQLSMLSMPQTLYSILPLVMILATIALFLSLARTSELVVTRAAGRSALRALAAPVAVALIIGGIGVAALNPMVAATIQQYEQRVDELTRGDTQVLSISSEGLWLRQGGPEGQTVIRAERANLDGTTLFNVTMIGFSVATEGDSGGPVRRIEAERAELTSRGWKLSQAKIWPLAVPNPEAEAAAYPQLMVPSTLTPDQIRDGFGTPAAVPIWELPTYITNLRNAGFSARTYEVWLQTELAMPLFLAAMVLIGAGFTMRHTRFGRTGLMVLFALLLGFGTYFLRNFAQVLGENGQIPPMLAAWAPPAIGILLSLGLLLHLEDG